MPNKLDRPCKWCRQVHSTVGRYLLREVFAGAAVDSAKANPARCSMLRTAVHPHRAAALSVRVDASEAAGLHRKSDPHRNTAMSV